MKIEKSLRHRKEGGKVRKAGDIRYVKDDSIVSRLIEGETILVPIRQRAADLDSIYTLNKVGSRIWELIDGKRKVKDIKKAIVDEFNVDEAKAEADIQKFLTQLEKIGAIRKTVVKGEK